jgi:PGF-CTERM protein
MSLVAGVMSGTAAAASASVDDVEVINVKDVDGDGRPSSFQVRVRANGDFPEPGGIGRGNPYISVHLLFKNGNSIKVAGRSVAQRDDEFIFQIDSGDIYDRDETILVNPKFTGVKAYIIDQDKGPGIFGANVAQDSLAMVMSDGMRTEPAKDDRLRGITIDSNVNGANVYVDGNKVGETPWTGEFPVDHADLNGRTHVELRKAGWQRASVNTELSPPDTVELDMRKVKKPIVVASEPDGANVYVDGTKVGTTPWAGQYWVQDSVDVRVEKTGYVTQEFTGVSAEATIHADLVSYSTTSDLVEPQMPLVTDADMQSIDSMDSNLVDVSLENSTSGDSTSSSNDTLITDFRTLEGSAVATGTESYSFASQLPNTLDRIGTLNGVVTANVTASPTDSVVAQTVTFDANDSYSLSSPIAGYSWEFGDGITASGEVVTHAYADPGTYEVTLEAETEDGTTATTTRRVEVVDRPPTARFGASSGRPVVGTVFTLNASASTDPEDQALRYEWELGDGTTQTGPTVSHSFSSAGEHEVTLTVTDANGNTDTATRTVRVLKPNEAPSASFQPSTTTVKTGTNVTFDASASSDPDGTIRTHGWAFGDGDIGSGETAAHAYEKPGTYNVTLTVLDDRGETHAVSKSIEVTGGAAAGSNSGSGTDASDDRGSSSDGDSAGGSTATVGGSGSSDGGSDGSADVSISVPGFGVGASVAALLVVALLFRRFEG